MNTIIAGVPFDGGLSGAVPIHPKSERYRIVSRWPEKFGDDVELVVLNQHKQFRRVMARLMRGDDGRSWLVQLRGPYPWERPMGPGQNFDVHHARRVRCAETDLEILDRLERLEIRLSTVELAAREGKGA